MLRRQLSKYEWSVDNFGFTGGSVAGEGLLLAGDEFGDAFGGQVEQGLHLGAGVGLAFGGALHFDVAAVGGHDDVHVGVAGAVFGVVEIKPGLKPTMVTGCQRKLLPELKKP